MLGKAAIARIVGEVTLGVGLVAATAEACKVPEKVRARTKDLQIQFDISANAIDKLTQYLIKDHATAITTTKKINTEITKLQTCAKYYKSNTSPDFNKQDCKRSEIEGYIKKIEQATTK